MSASETQMDTTSCHHLFLGLGTVSVGYCYQPRFTVGEKHAQRAAVPPHRSQGQQKGESWSELRQAMGPQCEKRFLAYSWSLAKCLWLPVTLTYAGISEAPHRVQEQSSSSPERSVAPANPGGPSQRLLSGRGNKRGLSRVRVDDPEQ